MNLSLNDDEYGINLRSISGSALNTATNTSVALSSGVTSFCGQTFSLVISFADGTTGRRTFKMPLCPTKAVSITSAVKNGNGSVTITYSIPTSDETSRVRMRINGDDTYDMLPFSQRTLTVPSDAELFTSGSNTIQLNYTDIYGRTYQYNRTLNY